jgi:hypothetical protein
MNSMRIYEGFAQIRLKRRILRVNQDNTITIDLLSLLFYVHLIRYNSTHLFGEISFLRWKSNFRRIVRENGVDWFEETWSVLQLLHANLWEWSSTMDVARSSVEFESVIRNHCRQDLTHSTYSPDNGFVDAQAYTRNHGCSISTTESEAIIAVKTTTC